MVGLIFMRTKEREAAHTPLEPMTQSHISF